MTKTFLIFLTLCLAGANCEWPWLRTTYKAIAATGFHDQPRTQAELDEQGWVQLSSCSQGNTVFPGDRWARSINDNDIVLVFDGNGYIAGMQTIVPFEKAMNDQYFAFSSSIWYEEGDFFGAPVYYTTAYFVDPSIICEGGRTEEDFTLQGTGNMIVLQKGSDPKLAANQEVIPLTQTEIIAGGTWHEHYCFYHMGYHFFTFNYDPNQSCETSVPFQVIYDLDGNLNAVVFQHIAGLESSRFETVDDAAINNILNTPPTCLYDFADVPGIKALHTYVSDYMINCP